jgi:hypothetical protein
MLNTYINCFKCYGSTRRSRIAIDVFQHHKMSRGIAGFGRVGGSCYVFCSACSSEWGAEGVVPFGILKARCVALPLQSLVAVGDGVVLVAHRFNLDNIKVPPIPYADRLQTSLAIWFIARFSHPKCATCQR